MQLLIILVMPSLIVFVLMVYYDRYIPLHCTGAKENQSSGCYLEMWVSKGRGEELNKSESLAFTGRTPSGCGKND